MSANDIRKSMHVKNILSYLHLLISDGHDSDMFFEKFAFNSQKILKITFDFFPTVFSFRFQVVEIFLPVLAFILHKAF